MNKETMKKPNVAIFASAKGGIAHYATHLYEPLGKYANLHYITYSDDLVDDLVKNNVGKVNQTLKAQSASSILMTLKYLKENKIDFINFHVATTARKLFLYYTALLSAAKLMNIKVIGTIHDVMPFETFYIDPAALELLYSCIDYYLVGNENELGTLQLYFDVPKNKIDIVEHGPYTLFDSGKYTRESARKKLGIAEDKKMILFFGLLRPHKGLKYILKAFKKISKTVPDSLLYIASDLSYNPELNDLLRRVERYGVADSIKMSKGYIPSCDLEPIFKAADLVVLPYTQVSQSGVLNLAYAFKKPVVVTDIFPDANLINRNFGRVVETEDVISLENTIIELLQNPVELKKMGQAGYDYAIKNRSWEKAALEISHIFDKLS
jgi:glycosyltransferase involved in cell wall biosynthesis